MLNVTLAPLFIPDCLSYRTDLFSLSQSVRSLHHQLITIDSSESQIIQYDTYGRQASSPSQLESHCIQIVFQDKHKREESNVITYQQKTAEHRHTNLQHTVTEQEYGA